MRMLNTLAWRNLRQHPLRTGLTAAAIALGVAMVIAADMVSGAARSVSDVNGSGEVAIGPQIMGGMLNFGLNMAGVVILVAAGSLIFNAFAMTITQRRQQIGALRSLGMTRRQVLRQVLVESLLTGLMGIVLGIISGPLLGGVLIALIQLAVNLKFGSYSISFASVIGATVLGLSITMLSTFIPAWNASAISPLAALREPETEDVEQSKRWPFWGGVVIIAVMFADFLLAPPSAWTLPPWDYVLTGLFAVIWLLSLGLLLSTIINTLGRWLRVPLSRWSPAAGRLITDNLRRQRRRVNLTILTLTVGLAMIVFITGVMELLVTTLVKATAASEPVIWTFAPIDVTNGVAIMSEVDLANLVLPSSATDSIEKTIAGRADIINLYMVEVPELSFLIPHMPSFVFDSHLDEQMFSFLEGDWESARPILDSGCGVLTAPMVARNNGVWLYDTLTITGADGPVECTIAGIGGHSLMNVSLIHADPALFGVVDPTYVIITGISPGDTGLIQTLDQDIRTLADQIPGVWATGSEVFDVISNNDASFREAMVGPLLLAILAAALGVVNTTLMSVSERRRELGLLRAVGSTRRQVRTVVMGEAALIGLIGAVIGFIAGVGCVIIVAVVAGGNAFGVRLDPWTAAWTSVRATFLIGFMGIIFAPIISALAARGAMRGILREKPIETLALR